MDGLDNLNARVRYLNGYSLKDRLKRDKLRSFKKALKYSYQAETAVLPDGREFKCLINDNKLSADYDEKLISIPYEDVCLNAEKVGKTSEGIVPTNIASGQVFEWKENGTFWIIYLHRLEESSYFRGNIRKCDCEIDINGNIYKAYIRGAEETDINWNQKNNTSWNEMNYSHVVYITKNEETEKFFHRFTKVKIDGNTWETAVVNPYYGDGIIKVCLNEYFNNEMEESIQTPDEDNNSDETTEPYINGSSKVYPYDIVTYKIMNADGGNWVLSNNKAKIVSSDAATALVEIVSGKSGNFELSYCVDEEIICSLPVVIDTI
jgi:hypothetical protein